MRVDGLHSGARRARVGLMVVLFGLTSIFGFTTGTTPEKLLPERETERTEKEENVRRDVEPTTPGSSLDFTLKDMDGHAIRLSQWRGHPVVVEFWATWCAPCREQIPELKGAYTRYHDSEGLVVVGIACDTVQGDGLKAIRPFVKKNSMHYPILVAEQDLIEKLQVESVPTTFLVGRDGVIVDRVRGAEPPGELSDQIRQLVDGAGVVGTRNPVKQIAARTGID